jgi:hypothetical protein
MRHCKLCTSEIRIRQGRKNRQYCRLCQADLYRRKDGKRHKRGSKSSRSVKGYKIAPRQPIQFNDLVGQYIVTIEKVKRR